MIDHPSLVIRAGNLASRSTVLAKLRAIRDVKLEEFRPDFKTLQSDPRARQPIETLLDDSWIDVAVDNYLHLARHVTNGDDQTIAALLRADGTILFEGAQGVLLDETFGFHPHTTWSNTTFANADTLLNEAGDNRSRLRVGVLRSYASRHGAGPFVTEDPLLNAPLREFHNADDGWQGRFRVGPFDAIAARYAIAVAGPVDRLAITHLDRLRQLPSHICTGYSCNDAIADDICFVRDQDKIVDLVPLQRSVEASARRTTALFQCKPLYLPIPTDDPRAFVAAISSELRSKVGITSFGPRANDKQTACDL